MENENLNYNQAPNYKRKSPIPMAIEPSDVFDLIEKLNVLNVARGWMLSSFGSFLYLSGARVSEALMTKYKDLILIEGGYRLRLRTLKARVYPIREIVITPAKSDKPFYKIVNEFINDGREHDPDELLFPFASRYVINNFFKRIQTGPIMQLDSVNKTWLEEPYRLHPHYFRHCRLSHLQPIFGLTDWELVRFAGWSSLAPAKFYIKVNYRDILKRMVGADWVAEHAKTMVGEL